MYVLEHLSNINPAFVPLQPCPVLPYVVTTHSDREERDPRAHVDAFHKVCVTGLHVRNRLTPEGVCHATLSADRSFAFINISP